MLRQSPAAGFRRYFGQHAAFSFSTGELASHLHRRARRADVKKCGPGLHGCVDCFAPGTDYWSVFQNTDTEPLVFGNTVVSRSGAMCFARQRSHILHPPTLLSKLFLDAAVFNYICIRLFLCFSLLGSSGRDCTFEVCPSDLL